MGYIYILTNPSFEDYIKIGYAEDVNHRLNRLNRGSHTPFAFRVYATYEVDTPLSDKQVHSIIDMLNPDLRSIDHIDGKKRKREFYKMTKEDAYNLLKAIAEIHNRGDKLRLVIPSQKQVEEEEIAQSLDDTVYTEDYHINKGEADIVALYQLLKSQSISAFDVYAESKKFYIAFKKGGKNIFDVVIQKHKLKLFLNLPKGRLKDPLEFARDISDVGHWGNGDYQLLMSSELEIEPVLALIKQSVIFNQ